MLLGDHLILVTREKILIGKFVGSALLEAGEKDKEDLEDSDKEQSQVDHNWANWLPWFLIYVGVLARLHPVSATPLFHCIAVVYRAYTEFAGEAWLQYDEGRNHPDCPLGPAAPTSPVDGTDQNGSIAGSLCIRTRLLHLPRCKMCSKWKFTSQGARSRKPCKF